MTNELALFSRLMAVLLKCGVPLTKALTLSLNDLRSREFKSAVQAIIARIESGSFLSEAMEENQQIFPPSMIAIIEAAEEKGTLPENFISIAQAIESGLITMGASETRRKQSSGHFRREDTAKSTLDYLLDDAVKKNATDIHFIPLRDALEVRFRVDGVLTCVERLSKELENRIIAWIKLMAGCNVSEKLYPQEGKFLRRAGKKEYVARVNFTPSALGEKVTIKLIAGVCPGFELENIVESSSEAAELKKLLANPSGLVVVAGPCGSGKTTTVFSMLKHLQENTGLCIVTVEDPIEFVCEGIIHTQVRIPAEGFPDALRNILRTDPDVIYISEMRDSKTLELAAKSALGGKLIFTDIYARNAIDAVKTLLETGCSPYLIASSLCAVVAQVLLRRPCEKCSSIVDIDSDTVRRYLVSHGVRTVETRGCPACHGTGYRGRFAIFEILRIDSELKELIQGGDIEGMKLQAIKKGLISLKQKAVMAALDRKTTFSELDRIMA